MLTMIAKLLVALNSDNSSRQLALAIAMGMIVGLTPMLTLHNIIILLLAFVLRVHLGAYFLSAAAFSGLAFFTAAPFAQLGEQLLNNPGLAPFWTGLYQVDFLKLTHFHHTLTLGSLVASLILFVPMIYFNKYLIDKYRKSMRAFVDKFNVVQAFKRSRLYQAYLDMIKEEHENAKN